ncbi:MAG: acylneuraminate cytidylyltransferase family protein [Patescibacteria group bacterium]
MEILAIIPARGGSKSIPRKNIKELCGKPLIAWTIEEAKKSKYITRVIVSTDDEEIASIAKQYGAEVPFLRPKEISGDYALDIEFLTHALDFLKEKGYEPELVLRLPPISPLRTAEHIDDGIETLLKNPDADSVRPITEAPKHPYKMWRINESDSRFLESFLPESFTHMHEPHNMPRQALPTAYIHTGAMDVLRLRTIRELASTCGNKVAYFFMKPEDSVNIDYEIDFEFAELLMKKRIERKNI